MRFEDPEAAGLALALDGQEYLGHQLKVKAGKKGQWMINLWLIYG